MALLLPKFRSHFAEFLNNASPVGLRILSSSTCVGLRYGYIINNSGFSWQPAHILPALRPTSRIQIVHRICLMHSYLACTGFSIPGLCSLSASPQFCYDISTGIFTCYPSTTSFDLALGPDLPRADQLYSGNLRYSARRILTFLSLLIPAFSLLTVHCSFRYSFAPLRMLLYQLTFINS